MGTPYQWYLDGVVLNNDDFTGETAQILVWSLPLPSGYSGAFNCQTGSGLSRSLFVFGSDLLPPSNVQITIVDDDAQLSWSTSAGATYYKIYRSTSVNTGFGLIGSTANTTFTDVGAASQDKYFYRVTAVAGSD